GTCTVLCLAFLCALAQPAAAQISSSVAVVPTEPVSAILSAFRTHRVVGIGDAHGNAQGPRFQIDLVRDARFVETVDDILVELGNSKHQDVLDRFIAGEDVPEESLIRVWQDTAQPQAAPWSMPELFRVVREVNRQRGATRRIRILILLGEPPIDWGAVRTAEDLKTYRAISRDQFAVALVRREVLTKGRRVLMLYGAGHLFRKNVTHSIVSLLEDSGTAVFTVFTNSMADLARVQPDIATWPVPSLTAVRGTILGQLAFEQLLGPKAGDIPPEWRVPTEDQFDSVLYLGHPDKITFAPVEAWPCAAAKFAERLRRAALIRAPIAERLKKSCRP
ncbi:MAG TPA: hypothetical protein VMO26_15415, partial [Vicinamibacterales bacterium]|nr:hypothetical protein [Vicinamibacterales bacterium]